MEDETDNCAFLEWKWKWIDEVAHKCKYLWPLHLIWYVTFDLTLTLIDAKITLIDAKTILINTKSNLKYLPIKVQNCLSGSQSFITNA